MDSVLKMNTNMDNEQTVKQAPKKQRIGRWTQSEAYLFETLLERHGKNWKKIHQHMKGRTLSQIRSHGQKYFGKIGSKKVEELSRRAKLLEAYETLENEKRLQEELAERSSVGEERELSPMVKMEEESPVTVQESSVQAAAQPAAQAKPSEIIKEQVVNKSQQIKKQQAPAQSPQNIPTTSSQAGYGYLISLIQLYPETFNLYGINGFIDCPQFRNSSLPTVSGQ